MTDGHVLELAERRQVPRDELDGLRCQLAEYRGRRELLAAMAPASDEEQARGVRQRIRLAASLVQTIYAVHHYAANWYAEQLRQLQGEARRLLGDVEGGRTISMPWSAMSVGGSTRLQ
jgi:hypothetical protein